MATRTRKDAALDFLRLIVAGDVKGAYDKHVGDGFRHHNPYFPGDAASLMKGMMDDEAKNPGKKLDVRAALEDGDFVAVHSRLQRPGGQDDIAVVHVFRFAHGRIAELWDIGQIVPKNAANRHGMF